MRFIPDCDKKHETFINQRRLYQHLVKVPFSYKTLRSKTLDELSYDVDGQAIVSIA